jgi:hypothetical protein
MPEIIQTMQVYLIPAEGFVCGRCIFRYSEACFEKDSISCDGGYWSFDKNDGIE